MDIVQKKVKIEEQKNPMDQIVELIQQKKPIQDIQDFFTSCPDKKSFVGFYDHELDKKNLLDYMNDYYNNVDLCIFIKFLLQETNKECQKINTSLKKIIIQKEPVENIIDFINQHKNWIKKNKEEKFFNLMRPHYQANDIAIIQDCSEENRKKIITKQKIHFLELIKMGKKPHIIFNSMIFIKPLDRTHLLNANIKFDKYTENERILILDLLFCFHRNRSQYFIDLIQQKKPLHDILKKMNNTGLENKQYGLFARFYRDNKTIFHYMLENDYILSDFAIILYITIQLTPKSYKSCRFKPIPYSVEEILTKIPLNIKDKKECNAFYYLLNFIDKNEKCGQKTIDTTWPPYEKDVDFTKRFAFLCKLHPTYKKTGAYFGAKNQWTDEEIERIKFGISMLNADDKILIAQDWFFFNSGGWDFGLMAQDITKGMKKNEIEAFLSALQQYGLRNLSYNEANFIQLKQLLMFLLDNRHYFPFKKLSNFSIWDKLKSINDCDFDDFSTEQIIMLRTHCKNSKKDIKRFLLRRRTQLIGNAIFDCMKNSNLSDLLTNRIADAIFNEYGDV